MALILHTHSDIFGRGRSFVIFCFDFHLVYNISSSAAAGGQVFQQKISNFWRIEDVKDCVAPTLSTISNGLGKRIEGIIMKCQNFKFTSLEKYMYMYVTNHLVSKLILQLIRMV